MQSLVLSCTVSSYPTEDKENGALLLKLACLSNADSLTLFQYAVAASNDTTKFKSGVQMQMHLLSMLYDKLWRIKQEQAIKEVLAVLLAPCVLNGGGWRDGLGKAAEAALTCWGLPGLHCEVDGLGSS